MVQSETYLLDKDFKLLEDHGKVVSYSPQEVILQQDTTPDSIYLIRSGMVQVDFSRVYGNDVLAYLGQGEFFGEVSFLDNAQTSANVTAAKACEVLTISRDQMDQLLDSQPALAARFFRTIALTLARRIRASNVH